MLYISVHLYNYSELTSLSEEVGREKPHTEPFFFFYQSPLFQTARTITYHLEKKGELLLLSSHFSLVGVEKKYMQALTITNVSDDLCGEHALYPLYLFHCYRLTY